MIARLAPVRAGVCGLLSIMAGALPLAARAADAEHGEVMAKRWCASCHVVSSDQKTGSTQAPPFSAIAKMPDFDAAKVAFFLLAPHPQMPDIGLTRNDAADLAAYIANQK